MSPRRRESTYAGHALHLRARRAQNVAMAIRLPCLLLLPLLATSGATEQESDITIYRCTGPAGHLTLQDSPCADDQTQQVRRMIQPIAPPPRAEPVDTAAMQLSQEPPPPPVDGSHATSATDDITGATRKRDTTEAGAGKHA